MSWVPEEWGETSQSWHHRVEPRPSLMRRALRWLASVLPEPRIIKDREGTSPYLSRYYLVGRERGQRGVAVPSNNFGIYLHQFHRGDDDAELHNHPWQWAVSLVLSGGYIEERRLKGWASKYVVRREVRPGDLNWIMADDFHRVELLSDEAWSLFIVGPKVTGWGFWNRTTGDFLPWRKFIQLGAEVRQREEARS